jgi:hypothetical protein
LVKIPEDPVFAVLVLVLFATNRFCRSRTDSVKVLAAVSSDPAKWANAIIT